MKKDKKNLFKRMGDLDSKVIDLILEILYAKSNQLSETLTEKDLTILN
jgi:hypothetical protein